jgi:hypothetical protein
MHSELSQNDTEDTPIRQHVQKRSKTISQIGSRFFETGSLTLLVESDMI